MGTDSTPHRRTSTGLRLVASVALLALLLSPFIVGTRGQWPHLFWGALVLVGVVGAWAGVLVVRPGVIE